VDKFILTISDSPNPSMPKGGKCERTSQNARKILQSLGIGQPITPGIPAALVTGYLQLFMKNRKRTFNIYNELLLNEEANPDVYFKLKKRLNLKICSH
jgi:hypothetical protein